MSYKTTQNPVNQNLTPKSSPCLKETTRRNLTDPRETSTRKGAYAQPKESLGH